MIAVHQFLPGLAPADAVASHAVAMHEALRRADMDGRIWADRVDPTLAALASPYSAYADRSSRPEGERSVLLYQAYVGSEPLAGFLLGREEPLSVYYHNITPSQLLKTYDPGAADLMDQGREELRRLAPQIRIALAGSSLSACEMAGLGVQDVRLLPPYDRHSSAAATDTEYEDWLRRSKSGIDLLFVGRVAPHKGHSHLLRMMALLRVGGSTDVRLFIVGPSGPPSYMFALEGQRQRLSLTDAVVITGPVSEARLAAHYRTADVFVCMSEHEGFCIPLLEAMRAGVPVVAHAAGAVPETLGGTGVLLGSLDPFVAAEVTLRVAGDPAFRQQLCENQSARAAELDGFDRDRVLTEAMRELAEA